MDRRRYVGTLVSSTDAQGCTVEHVLTEFLGEGSTSIVFAVAPRGQPGEQTQVMKFPKPQPRFELGVLHHSLQVATELHPEHPLLMPPALRLQRLAAEMQQRMASPGVVFHARAFVDLMCGTVDVLLSRFLDRHLQGSLPDGFLADARGIALALDEGLALHMERLLDEDAVSPVARGFVAHCVQAVRAHAAGGDRPALSHNRAWRLLALHLADYLSFDELVDVLTHEDFVPPLQPADLMQLDAGCGMLRFRAELLQQRGDEDFAAVHAAAQQAARLLQALIERRFPDAPEPLRAGALLWQAQLHLLKRQGKAARGLLQRALRVAEGGAAPEEERIAREMLAGLPSAGPAGA